MILGYLHIRARLRMGRLRNRRGLQPSSRERRRSSLLLFSCSSRTDEDAAIELASISALITELNQTIAPHSPVVHCPLPLWSTSP